MSLKIYYPLQIALATLLICSTLICCNPNSTKDSDSLPTSQSTAAYEKAKAGSETSVGIAPPKFSDTINITDPLAKDSIKMQIAFQLAANELSAAYINKNAKTYARFTLPTIVTASGGASAYLQKLQGVFNNPNTPVYSKILSGPIQKTKPRLDDQGYLQGWYCLMPVRMFRKEATKTIQDIKWMGGQSLDEGKTIYFIDITNMPPEKIMQIMPDLRVALIQE